MNSIHVHVSNPRLVLSYRSVAVPLTAMGLFGALITAILAFTWVPVVDSEAWNAPDAYRIIFWHVPFAWVSFLAFCLLFIGSISWYRSRSEKGWSMVVVGSELGLLFGLGVVISGPIWGLAEWGVPWDWGDVRLNTYALLTGVALFLTMSLRSQPEGEETRDTLAAIGLFGFFLVPITAIATTVWRNRHPGVILAETEETGLDPEIRLVLIIGAVSFITLFAGLVALNYHIHTLKEKIETMNKAIDEGY